MGTNRATDEQIEALVSYMEMHSLFARQQIPKLGKNGKRKFFQMWSTLAESLNNMGPAIKNVKGWQETWTFLRKKSKKNKIIHLQQFNKTGNTSPICILTDVDERISCIFGKYGTGLSLRESALPNIIPQNLDKADMPTSRKRGTEEQMEEIFRFMEGNTSFARGTVSLKVQNTLWDALKKKLDKIPNGEIREVGEWKKCWRELKLRTVKKLEKRTALKPRQIRIRNILGLQCSASALTKTEFTKKLPRSQPKASSSSNGLSVNEMAFLLDMPLPDNSQHGKIICDLTADSEEETPKSISAVPLEKIFIEESSSEDEEPPRKRKKKNLPEHASQLNETNDLLRKTVEESLNFSEILLGISDSLRLINLSLLSIKEVISDLRKENAANLKFEQQDVILASIPIGIDCDDVSSTKMDDYTKSAL